MYKERPINTSNVACLRLLLAIAWQRYGETKCLRESIVVDVAMSSEELQEEEVLKNTYTFVTFNLFE